MRNGRTPPTECRGKSTVPAIAVRVISLQYDPPNRLAVFHQVEPVVDFVERHRARDPLVTFDIAVHVSVDDLRHVGAPAPLKDKPFQ